LLPLREKTHIDLLLMMMRIGRRFFSLSRFFPEESKNIDRLILRGEINTRKSVYLFTKEGNI
jgi:hypothetical protein